MRHQGSSAQGARGGPPAHPHVLLPMQPVHAAFAPKERAYEGAVMIAVMVVMMSCMQVVIITMLPDDGPWCPA